MSGRASRKCLGDCRHLHVETVGGAAGDMFLGALLDLGADAALLRGVLDKIEVGLELGVNDVTRAGRPAKGLRVATEEEHERLHAHHHHHPHAIMRQIDRMQGEGTLNTDEVALAKAIYGCLIAGEAEAHECRAEDVHLHEVGEPDSFFDIVGFARACGGRLPQSISHSLIPEGSGEVVTSHGTLSVPVPAVRAIFRQAGIEMHELPPRGECVTPTGAAILSTLRGVPMSGEAAVERLGEPSRIGRGAGRRDPSAYPNVLELWVWD